MTGEKAKLLLRLFADGKITADEVKVLLNEDEHSNYITMPVECDAEESGAFTFTVPISWGPIGETFYTATNG